MHLRLKAIIDVKSGAPGNKSQALKLRTTRPILSVVSLPRSPLRKLAWLFGICR